MRRELKEKTAEAVEFIKGNTPPGETLYIGFSGGKDSISVLQLVKMSGVKFKAYYAATGLDPAEIIKFIKQYHPDVEWLRPKMSFWEGIRLKGFPTASKRWCCDILKKRPGYQVPLKFRVMGIRAAESRGREERGRITTFDGRTYLHPIFDWTDEDVWEFIKAKRLPYPGLYHEGFRRLGCVVCPFVSSGPRLQRHRERFPAMYRLLDKSLLREWEKITPSGMPNSELLEKEGWTQEMYLSYPNWPTRKERMRGKPLVEKQRAAAFITARRKRGRTEKRIREAVARLRKQGRRLSVTAVATEAGISRQVLNRLYPGMKAMFKVPVKVEG
ncbi:MAG: TetR/AcrR family transcriptional regulator [Thermodesulfovibrionales bacterium]